MNISKSAFSRYRVIDNMLKNIYKPYPTLLDIQEACSRNLDYLPSLNTLEKDIKNMKDPDVFDAPIVYCRKNRGYFYTNSNYSLNAIPLTDHDISSIKEALDLINNLGGHNRVNKRFSDAIQKILAAYKEQFPENNTQRKIIQTDFVEGTKGIENFNLLFESCKNQTPISFVHYSYAKRAFKSVTVHPIRLKEFDNKWYLIGYSEFHKSLRTFGIDRIYDPIILKKKFISCKEKDIDAYCHDIYGVYPIEHQKKQTITFLTSSNITNYFEAYPIHSSQKPKKNESGSCFFKVHLIPSMELVKLFRSYGKHLKVITPIWLKEQTQTLL